MDLVSALLEVFQDNPILLVGVMAVPALALLGIVAFTFLQGRRQVRRRAADGVAEVVEVRSASRPSLERLLTYVEANLAGGDERDQRVLRMRLMQAGFFDGRAVAWFFAARLGAAVVLAIAGVFLLPIILPEDQQGRVLLW